MTELIALDCRKSNPSVLHIELCISFGVAVSLMGNKERGRKEWHNLRGEIVKCLHL